MVKLNVVKKFAAALSMASVAVLCALASSSQAAIPNKELIAVVADGSNEQHIRSAEAIMTQHLLMSGYKPADEQKMKQLRAAANASREREAVKLALQGNVKAIMNLGSKVGLSKFTTVAIRVDAGQPAENEFKLFTGTATLSVVVTGSNGARLYADTVSGKQVGYTQDEAAQKSIEAAARLAVEKMTK
ncbi:MAG: hypothetical protein LBS75_06925 [Synergistaceae bacterium]|jgi:hypothetical protein|nr:hypothetical protein [Synergistaceae bacterium]